MNAPRTPAAEHVRPVRSFVRRQGRITRAQQDALVRLLPRYALDVTHDPFELAALFRRDAPCTLEIGFGNGDTLLTLACAHPHEDFIGVEVHRPGIGRLLLGLESHALTNVRVVCADALEVLSGCMPDASLSAILIYFPDPWPKKRHHKRRLVQPEFAALVARKLKRGGQLHLATDWPDYAEHMLAVLVANPDFSNAAGTGFAPRPAARLLTRFEHRGLKLGHAVRDLVFIRR